MQIQNKNEKILAKYLIEWKKLIWNEYLTRFKNIKPLEIWPTAYNELKMVPEEVECNIKLLSTLNNKFVLKKLANPPKIIGGFKKKVTKKEIEDLKYLNTNFLGLGMLFHKNIIDIMLSICPDDFEPVPVTLISLNKAVDPFEIKEFYAINVLKCIEAIDEQNSNLKFAEDGYCFIKKFKYKENPWQDGVKLSIENNKTVKQTFKYDKPCMLAIDSLSGAIVWHPKLAEALPISPMVWFIQDIEQI